MNTINFSFTNRVCLASLSVTLFAMLTLSGPAMAQQIAATTNDSSIIRASGSWVCANSTTYYKDSVDRGKSDVYRVWTIDPKKGYFTDYGSDIISVQAWDPKLDSICVTWLKPMNDSLLLQVLDYEFNLRSSSLLVVSAFPEKSHSNSNRNSRDVVMSRDDNHFIRKPKR